MAEYGEIELLPYPSPRCCRSPRSKALQSLLKWGGSLPASVEHPNLTSPSPCSPGELASPGCQSPQALMNRGCYWNWHPSARQRSRPGIHSPMRWVRSKVAQSGQKVNQRKNSSLTCDAPTSVMVCPKRDVAVAESPLQSAAPPTHQGRVRSRASASRLDHHARTTSQATHSCALRFIAALAPNPLGPLHTRCGVKSRDKQN